MCAVIWKLHSEASVVFFLTSICFVENILGVMTLKLVCFLARLYGGSFTTGQAHIVTATKSK